jgi:hypothetical protein
MNDRSITNERNTLKIALLGEDGDGRDNRASSLRAGTNLGDWSASLFVDNLTDTHSIVNYNHQKQRIRG